MIEQGHVWTKFSFFD